MPTHTVYLLVSILQKLLLVLVASLWLEWDTQMIQRLTSICPQCPFKGQLQGFFQHCVLMITSLSTESRLWHKKSFFKIPSRTILKQREHQTKILFMAGEDASFDAAKTSETLLEERSYVGWMAEIAAEMTRFVKCTRQLNTSLKFVLHAWSGQ